MNTAVNVCFSPYLAKALVRKKCAYVMAHLCVCLSVCVGVGVCVGGGGELCFTHMSASEIKGPSNKRLTSNEDILIHQDQ